MYIVHVQISFIYIDIYTYIYLHMYTCMYMFMSKNEKLYVFVLKVLASNQEKNILQNLTHGKAVCDWNAAGPKYHEIFLKKLS